MSQPIKIKKNGRASYSPVKNIEESDVIRVLSEKIDKETVAISMVANNFNSSQQLSLNYGDGDDESYELLSLIGNNRPIYIEDKINVISLFCGAGGLDLGLELATFDSIDEHYGRDKLGFSYTKQDFTERRKKSIIHHMYSNDIFGEALETYRYNISNELTCIHNMDIRRISKFPKSDIVIGGFPCPGFSEGGPRLIDDPRNFLYCHYVRCLRESKPKFFVAENVSGMKTLANGLVFSQIKKDFESAGYFVYDHEVNSADYGVPQLRHRVFLIGVRIDLSSVFKYELPNKTNGDGTETPYTTLRILEDLQEDPGYVYNGGYSSIYMSRNRKKTWDEPSFTIQASGRQAPLHPSGSPMVKISPDKWIFSTSNNQFERRLSTKEIARIQTFPDWWDFKYVMNEEENGKEPNNHQINKIYKQIGNAVPPHLARVVLRPIADEICKPLLKSN